MEYNSESNPALVPGMVLPFSPEAEQSVLGAIILEPSCLSEVINCLPNADYFYQSNNRRIYSAMLEMFLTGKPVDFVTVLEQLKQSPEYDEATDKVYLTRLAQLVPSISNVTQYCEIVRDRFDLRRLILTARSILDDAGEGAGTASNLLDSAEQRILEIRREEMRGMHRINEVLLQTFERLDVLNSPDREKYQGIPTGIKELDATITGLQRSDLIILGARPGMGKTSFALNIARHAAVSCGRKVAFFSLEMSNEQLASRMLATEALVSSTKLRTGEISEPEWARLVEGGDILSKAELYFDDTSGNTVPKISAKLRRLKGVDLAIVDYLQLMSNPTRTSNRVEEVSAITRSLKLMAKELHIPVLVCAQLARESEKRPDHRPVLSDLRESGSIEQDADIVLFLYREGYFAGKGGEGAEVNQNKSEVIVAKNRHGETRSIPLHWQGEFTRFTAQEYVHHEE